MEINRQGILFCLIGPAGVGKTTISQRLLKDLKNLSFSISVTSRPARPNEKEAQDYYFVNAQQFEEKISNNQFVEWEQVHGNYYGTLKSSLEQAITKSQDLILDIDIKGALNLKHAYQSNTVIVFIAAPSLETLKQRMLKRGTSDLSEINKRIETAAKEYQILLANQPLIDYLVVNQDLEQSYQELNSILCTERLRLSRLAKNDLQKICN